MRVKTTERKEKNYSCDISKKERKEEREKPFAKICSPEIDVEDYVFTVIRKGP